MRAHAVGAAVLLRDQQRDLLHRWAAAEHKERVTDYVAELLDGRAELAGPFVMLMDGAIVTALRERTTAPAHHARAVAAALLNASQDAESGLS
ncbi:hypothetical protein [Nonomuraea africana]|uniref:hypothetical protein n=1 Tax=Nonomuraea africana TaxID=46171 RepID=UPI003409E7A7